MALKTIRKQKNAADRKMDVMVTELKEMTGEYRIALRQEPEYFMWLLADIEGDQINYRVTDGWDDFSTQSMTFRCFTEANAFYSDLLSAGSWTEFKKEVKRQAVLEKAGLKLRPDDAVMQVYNKAGTKYYGYIDNVGKFYPAADLHVARDETQRKIFKAMSDFREAK